LISRNRRRSSTARYTFARAWAARFLAAARQAKDILASSEAEWQRLAPRIRVTDASALAIYRQRYGEGVARRPLAEEEADARALYLVLSEIGGRSSSARPASFPLEPSTGRLPE
jgi:NitT/TauT family transport system substrate-binding protein